MNPFNYSLAEAKKAVVALIVTVAAGAAFVIHFDPSFTQAVIVLAGAVFGVIGVFASRNASKDDVSKAVAQLQGAALSIVGFFTTVNPGTVSKISSLAAAAIAVLFVHRTPNAPKPKARKT